MHSVSRRRLLWTIKPVEETRHHPIVAEWRDNWCTQGPVTPVSIAESVAVFACLEPQRWWERMDAWMPKTPGGVGALQRPQFRLGNQERCPNSSTASIYAATSYYVRWSWRSRRWG